MRVRDLITAGAVLALAAGAGALTSNLPVRSLPNTPAPSFFPWVVIAFVAVLALILLARAMVAAPADAAPGSEDSTVPVKAAAVTLGLFAAYIVLMPRLGFVVVTVPFLAAMAALYGERRPAAIASLALGATATFYVLFRHLFQIVLPQGLLEGIVP